MCATMVSCTRTSVSGVLQWHVVTQRPGRAAPAEAGQAVNHAMMIVASACVAQEVLHVHVPHYCHMFELVMAGPRPWRFGHVYLPGGSANLGNPCVLALSSPNRDRSQARAQSRLCVISLSGCRPKVGFDARVCKGHIEVEGCGAKPRLWLCHGWQDCVGCHVTVRLWLLCRLSEAKV